MLHQSVQHGRGAGAVTIAFEPMNDNHKDSHPSQGQKGLPKLIN